LSKLNIALDGPAGSGKSSVAKMVAKKLKILYLDTGAMYRAIGYHILKSGIDIESKELVEDEVEKVKLDILFENGHQIVMINGKDVSEQIRNPEISKAASKVAAYRQVRGELVRIQKEIAKKHDMILDGRDIGTVVLSESKNKFFLEARSEVRAKRRYLELQSKGIEKCIVELKKEIDERDYFDSNREVDPLKKADDAMLIDSSELTIEQVADLIISNLGE